MIFRFDSKGNLLVYTNRTFSEEKIRKMITETFTWLNILYIRKIWTLEGYIWFVRIKR